MFCTLTICAPISMQLQHDNVIGTCFVSNMAAKHLPWQTASMPSHVHALFSTCRILPQENKAMSTAIGVSSHCSYAYRYQYQCVCSCWSQKDCVYVGISLLLTLVAVFLNLHGTSNTCTMHELNKLHGR